jgi:hypothetical protein
MKNFILSAILLAVPVTFPSKWGMSILDARQHKEKSPYLNCSDKQFREGMIDLLLVIAQEIDQMKDEIQYLQDRVTILENC